MDTTDNALPLEPLRERRMHNQTAPVAITAGLVACIAAFVVALATVLVVKEEIRGSVLTSCDRQNDVRRVLRRIMAAGEPELRKYEAEGTITKAQLERALESSKRNRALLRDVPCEATY